MVRFVSLIFLITFISISTLAEDDCAIVLSSFNDERINALSDEAQNMLIMSSLISSRLTIENPSTKTNFIIMLLSHLVTVNVNNQNKGKFHNFSLTESVDGNTLVKILKDLGALKTFQRFLLEHLQPNRNDLRAITIREGGEGLMLHFNEDPTKTVAIRYNGAGLCCRRI